MEVNLYRSDLENEEPYAKEIFKDIVGGIDSVTGVYDSELGRYYIVIQKGIRVSTYVEEIWMKPWIVGKFVEIKNPVEPDSWEISSEEIEIIKYWPGEPPYPHNMFIDMPLMMAYHPENHNFVLLYYTLNPFHWWDIYVQLVSHIDGKSLWHIPRVHVGDHKFHEKMADVGYIEYLECFSVVYSGYSEYGIYAELIIFRGLEYDPPAPPITNKPYSRVVKLTDKIIKP